MKKFTKDELLNWVVSYSYYEEGSTGVGHCAAMIKVRDEAKRLLYTFNKLTDDERKDIMCSLILKVGHPCEDFADDFDDKDSPFGFTCEYYGVAILFHSKFRV